MQTILRTLRLALRRETAMPTLALLFASGVCIAMVLARMLWTGQLRYACLGWNLFLAWLPLAFALLACDERRNGLARNWRFWGFAAAWLLFFPNAPYIFTDVVHLTTSHFGHFWVDLVLVLSCALTGLVLGFVSLYLMQAVVARRFGWLASWLFIAAVAGLSGFGICLGRFLRFNIWDVVFKPVALCHGVTQLAAMPLAHPTALAFPALFATFVFTAYLMLYALTHLQQLQPALAAGKPAA
jgi:uncharacterized membrane protein